MKMKELNHGDFYRIKHPMTGKWLKAEFHKSCPDSGAFDLFITEEGSLIADYVKEWK